MKQAKRNELKQLKEKKLQERRDVVFSSSSKPKSKVDLGLLKNLYQNINHYESVYNSSSDSESD